MKDIIIKLLKMNFIIMLEQRGNRVYLLWQHWKFVDWKDKAKRVLVGVGKVPTKYFSVDGKFFYISRIVLLSLVLTSCSLLNRSKVNHFSKIKHKDLNYARTEVAKHKTKKFDESYFHMMIYYVQTLVANR